MNKRVRRGILIYQVRRRGYSKDFDSWIPASSVRDAHVDPKQFYVTLLFNTSKNLYPDNTIAAFTAELARPVELGSSNNWEVRYANSPILRTVLVRLNTRQSLATLQA